jgi:hypothetical protein
VDGGLNLASYITPKNIDAGTFKSFPSYGFGIDIKGREPKPMHIGFSIEYYLNSINWKSEESGGLGGSTRWYDINYTIECLRFSLFPEFLIGKKYQFFCNLSPFFSLMIHSSKNGTSWTYNQSERIETGSASDDITKFDFGIKEGMGFGYAVKSFLVLSIEENGSLGIWNINKASAGDVNSAGLSIFFCLSFIIPKSKTEEQK